MFPRESTGFYLVKISFLILLVAGGEEVKHGGHPQHNPVKQEIILYSLGGF